LFSSPGKNLDEDLRHACCPVLAIHDDNDEYGKNQILE
jgi:hypothetical protein